MGMDSGLSKSIHGELSLPRGFFPLNGLALNAAVFCRYVSYLLLPDDPGNWASFTVAFRAYWKHSARARAFTTVSNYTAIVDVQHCQLGVSCHVVTQ